jgi:AI-2E family transporter
VIRAPFKARTSEELIALSSAVAVAVLAFMIITALYFGREIFVPIALAILLSFVLAPLVSSLQRVRVPRGLAVVSVVIFAFAVIFALGSLLAAQLTQLAGDLPRYQSTITEKIQSFRDTTAGRGTLERASGMLKDLSKELDPDSEGNPDSEGTGAANPSSRGSTPTRSGGTAEFASLDFAPSSSACHHGHHHHFCHLHFASARGFA